MNRDRDRRPDIQKYIYINGRGRERHAENEAVRETNRHANIQAGTEGERERKTEIGVKTEG